MKVLVIGANGQIGKHLVKRLKDSAEHTPVAMVRTKEQANTYQEQGIDTVYANLEGPVEALTEAVQGCDAVVFTAGSGGKTGFDKTLLVDLDGAAKSMEAAEKAGVERYIMVSAIQAHQRENWSDVIKPYYVAKHYADKILTASSLNYTIVRPGGLTNESGTGKIKVAEDLEGGFIPREDVAEVILASLTEAHTFRRSLDLLSGGTPVEKALKEF